MSLSHSPASSCASQTYLVTGGAGFIGSNFVCFVLREDSGARVRVLDRLSYSGNLASLHDVRSNPRFEFIKGDICDRATVERAFDGVDVVVNFAAEVSVDRSIRNADSFVRTGVSGVHTLLEESRRHARLKRFIQISTDEVYGPANGSSCSEISAVRPRNPYAAVKLGGETLALSYYETFGTPVVVTRASNTYGVKAHPEKVIPLFITNLIDGKKVPVFGDGSQVRDWLYVEDHCRAVDTVLRYGENGSVYNIGGGQECTNLELTRRILGAMGYDDSMIRFVNDRPGHDQRYSLNTDRLGALGWTPRWTLQDGLPATIEWYRQSEPWWRPLKDSSGKAHENGFWGDQK